MKFKQLNFQQEEMRKIASLLMYLVDGGSLSKTEIAKYLLKLETKKLTQQLWTKISKRLYSGEVQKDVGTDEVVLKEEENLSFHKIL